MHFLLKVDMSVMRAFVTMVERKGCHGDETEMMPRQHSDDPVAHGDTGAKGSGFECVMQEDGVLPVPASHMSTARQRGTRKEQLGHGATTSISNITHHSLTGVVSVVIPSKGAFSRGSSS